MKILIIENSRVARRIIREELLRGDYEVVQAGTGSEGLEILRNDRPELVTLNVESKDWDGFTTCRAIREWEGGLAREGQVRKPLPVVFITSDDTVEKRREGFAAGATDFLSKPFAPGVLLKVVDGILRPKPVWRGVRALVVEDSPVARHIVVQALHRLGVEVLEAMDGAQGWEIARAHADRIDLIVSDLHMPHLNGDALCEKVRRELGLTDIPFIMLSAESDKANMLRMFAMGATDFLIKPFPIEEFLARLKVHLEGWRLNRDLNRKNHQMREELQLARMVQEAALHDKIEAPFVRKAVIYQPYSEVSGDVYDFSITAGAAFNAFVGDATGHGVGAAIMTMMVQVALDSIGPDAPIDELLGRLHRLILERTGDQYVTGSYARIAPDGELTYSSAGHPPLALVPRHHSAALLNGLGGLPLGLLETSPPFEVGRQRLEPGDRVYLYTDGLVEWANAAEEQFGETRMLKSLSQGRGLDLKESVALVLGDVRAFAGEAPCPDDLTLIGLEFDPGMDKA